MVGSMLHGEPLQFPPWLVKCCEKRKNTRQKQRQRLLLSLVLWQNQTELSLRSLSLGFIKRTLQHRWTNGSSITYGYVSHLRKRSQPPTLGFFHVKHVSHVVKRVYGASAVTSQFCKISEQTPAFLCKAGGFSFPREQKYSPCVADALLPEELLVTCTHLGPQWNVTSEFNISLRTGDGQRADTELVSRSRPLAGNQPPAYTFFSGVINVTITTFHSQAEGQGRA